MLTTYQFLKLTLLLSCIYLLGFAVLSILPNLRLNFNLFIGLTFSIGSSLFVILNCILLIFHLPLNLNLNFIIILVFFLTLKKFKLLHHIKIYESILFDILKQLFIISTGAILILLNLYFYGQLNNVNYNLLHRDLYTFESIGNSIVNLGFRNSYFADGFVIKYHWFTYAWSSLINELVGLPPLFTITKILPFFSLIIATSLLSGLIKNYLKKDSVVSIIAGLMLTISTYINLPNGSHLNFDSPSQSLTVIWAFALMFFVINFTRFPNILTVTFLESILILSITLSKPSFLVPIIGGCVYLLFKERSRISLNAIIIKFVIYLMIPLVLYYLFLYGNSSALNGLKLFEFENTAPFTQYGNTNFFWQKIYIYFIFLFSICNKFVGLLNYNKIINRYSMLLHFSIGSLIFSSIFIFIVGDNSGSRVNIMWFVLAASTLLIPINAIGAHYAIKNLDLSKVYEIVKLILLFILLFMVYLSFQFKLNFILILILILLFLIVYIQLNNKNKLKQISIIFIVLLGFSARIFSTMENNNSFLPRLNFKQSQEKQILDENINPQLTAIGFWLRTNSIKNEFILTNLTQNYILTAISKSKFYYSSSESINLVGIGLSNAEQKYRIDLMEEYLINPKKYKIPICKLNPDYLITDADLYHLKKVYATKDIKIYLFKENYYCSS